MRSIPLAFAVAAFLLHMVFGGSFGYHHDEMYFVACGERLAFGYVDQPPLVPWVAALSRALFGDSLRGLRFFPALAGAAAIFLTGILTRRLGGGRFAQLVACLAMLIAPVYLRSQNLLSIPAFEPFFWVLASILLVRIIQEDRPKLWLALGAVAGLGLMTKHTMLFYGAGLVVGLLLTGERRQLRTPWFWVGGAVALLIFLPNLVWQAQNEWPTVQWLLGLNQRVMSRIPVSEFLAGQVIYQHPLCLVLWLAGLWFFFRSPDGRRYRVLGWIYVVVLAFLLVTKSKIYYLAPAYPALFAGGALLAERLALRRAWLATAIPVVMAIGGLALAPAALPILPIETTDRYIKVATLGLVENSYEVTADLHDQFGWQELVSLVARAYDTLDEDEKGRAVILVAGRGAASAVDFFGGEYGLPPARCGVLSYYLWGYGEGEVDVLVTVGFSRETLDIIAGDVTEVGTFTHEHVNPWRNNELVAICRQMNLTMEKLFPQLKRW